MELTEKQLDKARESIMDGSYPASFQNPGSRDVTVESLMLRFALLAKEALTASVLEKLEKAEGYAQMFSEGHISERRAIEEISETVNDPEVAEATARASPL